MLDDSRVGVLRVVSGRHAGILIMCTGALGRVTHVRQEKDGELYITATCLACVRRSVDDWHPYERVLSGRLYMLDIQICRWPPAG